MRIALATSASVPSWERDDEPLRGALRARGVELAEPIWDDPEVDWSRFAAVLIRTTWDYSSKRDEFVAWARRVASQTALFNPPAVVAWNTDKRYLRELEAVGVPIAPSAWFEVGARPRLAELVAERGLERGFLKPVVAANSRGTLRFDARDPEQLARAEATLATMLAREAMILQPYLPAVEDEGELSVIVFDGVISHAVRKIPVAGDYRVQDDHGARDQPRVVDAELRRCVDASLAGLARVAERRGWTLPLVYARIDLLRDPSGALLLNELELVEPSLFFRHGPAAAEHLAEVLLARCQQK